MERPRPLAPRTLISSFAFGYLHMVCVESGNIAENSILLASGERAHMKVELESAPLDWV